MRLLFVFVFLPGAAHAAPHGPESPEYTRAVRGALTEFEAGNFPEARALFATAHELYPNARTYRGLGFVEFELRNYEDSIGYLEAALSSNTKPLEGELRRSTQELLTRAKQMIAKVTLRIVPHAASVTIDGVPVTPSDAGPLTLPVGDHMLEVRSNGYVTQRRPLKVARGGTLAVNVELKRVEPERAVGPRLSGDRSTKAGEDAPRSPDARPGTRRWYASPWLWTSVVVVAAGAAAGTYFLLHRDDDPGHAPPPTTANTPQGGVIEALRSF